MSPEIRKSSASIRWLLVTDVIAQDTLASQLSRVATPIATETMRWFGGLRTLGVAVTLEMAGAVVSTTEIEPLQVFDRLPQGSVAVSVAAVDPKP